MPRDTPPDFIDLWPDSKPKAPVTEEKFTQQTAKMFTLMSTHFLLYSWQFMARLVNVQALTGRAGARGNRWNTAGSIRQLESELTT